MLVAPAVVAVAFVALLALFWVFQRRMIYFPYSELPPVETVLPGAREVSFETADGLRLGGWFLPVPGASRPVTVLVTNGNAGNRAYRAPLARALAMAGFQVLLFDYRGYGGNPGRPTEEGLLADARAARTWLGSTENVDPERIVYLGESLGTGVAVSLAAETPPMALVLRSPFTSLSDVGRVHYPFLPVRLMLRDRYASIDRIGAIRCPLLIVAGDADRVVPASLSQRLYEAAWPGTRKLLVLEGADHNDLELLTGERLIRTIAEFVREQIDEP